MMDAMHYIDCNTETPAPIDDQCWYRLRSRKISCLAPCSSLLPKHYGTAMEVNLRFVPPYAACPAPAVAYLRSDVFEILRPHLEGAVIGPCYLLGRDSSRTLTTEAVSCYTLVQHTVEILGGPGIKYAVCQTCGLRKINSAGSRGYLLSSQVRGRAVVQSNSHGGFLVNDDLRDQIAALNLPRTDFGTYSVRDKPLPGDAFPFRPGER